MQQRLQGKEQCSNGYKARSHVVSTTAPIERQNIR